MLYYFFFFVKQKTAYEMRISDWSSDVCSSDLTMGGEYLSDLRFDDVEVPLENLALRGDSLKRLMNAFNVQRCLNPAICLGLAESSLEESVRYSLDRKAFGGPLADSQGMRWKLADRFEIGGGACGDRRGQD